MSANCCCNLNPRPPASLFCARLIELHVFFCDFISSKSTVIFMIFELAIVVRLAADTGRAFLFTVFVIVYEKLCCLFWSYILIPESMIGVTTWEHPAAAKLFWGPRRPRDLNAEAFLGKLLLLVWTVGATALLARVWRPRMKELEALLRWVALEATPWLALIGLLICTLTSSLWIEESCGFSLSFISSFPGCRIWFTPTLVLGSTRVGV